MEILGGDPMCHLGPKGKERERNRLGIIWLALGNEIVFTDVAATCIVSFAAVLFFCVVLP